MQYSFNKQLIQGFNETIQDVQYNNEVLKAKIIQLYDTVKNRSYLADVLSAKDLLNQFVILYNVILNIFQDIENSLTFCKLKTLHPSIVKSHDLFLDLKRISTHFGYQLPFELNENNILEIESIIKVNCKVDSQKIIYLLTFPINARTKFDLYYLLSTPTKHESDLVTILPEVHYFLKSEDNQLKSLKDICIGSKTYQCPKELVSHHKPSCEEEILLDQPRNSCHYTKLKIEKNYLELIPEINQYLAVFPFKEELIVKCQDGTKTRYLQGIFLIKKENCKIIYKNEDLIYKSVSFGKPNIISELPRNFKIQKFTNFSVELKNLKLKEINLNPILPIQQIQSDTWHFNIWTIILYCIVILVACYLSIKILRTKILRRSKGEETIDQELGINSPPNMASS